MSLEEISRDKVRNYLVKVKLYQKFIYVFLAMGGVVFGFYFFNLMDGSLAKALSNITTIVVVAFAFVPAFVFSLYVRKLEAKLDVMMKKLEEREKAQTPS